MKLNQIVWNPFFTTLFTDNYQVTLQNLHLRFYPPFQAILVISAIFINQKKMPPKKVNRCLAPNLRTFSLSLTFFQLPRSLHRSNNKDKPQRRQKNKWTPSPSELEGKVKVLPHFEWQVPRAPAWNRFALKNDRNKAASPAFNGVGFFFWKSWAAKKKVN